MIIHIIKNRKEDFFSNKITKMLNIISEMFAIGEPILKWLSQHRLLHSIFHPQGCTIIIIFLKNNCIFWGKDNSILNLFISEFNNYEVKFITKNQCSSSKLELNTSNNCLNLYYQNVRSLRTKLNSLHTNFILLSRDILILTETWLTSYISDAELGLLGYKIFGCNRCKDTSDELRGGGISIAIKKK
jgi:hypothetical protein